MPQRSAPPRNLANAMAAVFGVLVCIALGYGCLLLWNLMLFEMHPVHHGGAGLTFTAVGRGILNGLLPYRDLFEFKPPGIFLLSAASLWLFEDNRLGNVVQGLSEIGILLLLLLPVILDLRRKRWKADAGVALTGCVSLAAGILLALYTGTRAGQFQTESIGSFVALAFLITVSGRTMPAWRTLAAAVLLVFSVGLKEPFIIIIPAALLTLLPVRQFPTRFLLPLAIAILAGLLALAALGYLDAYVSIYLPEILNGRSSFNPYPAWTLAFNGSFILRDLWAFSPLLPVSLAGLWTLSLIRMADVRAHPRALLGVLVLITVSAGLYFMAADAVTDFQKLQTSFDQTPRPADAIFWHAVLGIAVYVFLVRMSLRATLQRHDADRIFAAFLQHAAALLVSAICILAQGGYPQHLGMLLPLCAALVLSCRQLSGGASRASFLSPQSISLMVILAIMAAGIALLPLIRYGPVLEARLRDEQTAIAQAAVIDGLMSACGYDRYVVFGDAEGTVPYAYTRHSPFGPAFLRTAFTFPVRWRKPPIAYLQDTYRRHMQEADFLIARKVEQNGITLIEGTNIPEDVWMTFITSYTAEPPPCAAPFKEEGDMAFRFRKS